MSPAGTNQRRCKHSCGGQVGGAGERHITLAVPQKAPALPIATRSHASDTRDNSPQRARAYERRWNCAWFTATRRKLVSCPSSETALPHGNTLQYPCLRKVPIRGTARRAFVLGSRSLRALTGTTKSYRASKLRPFCPRRATPRKSLRTLRTACKLVRPRLLRLAAAGLRSGSQVPLRRPPLRDRTTP